MKRLDRPDKNWKFSSADVREREHWDDYQYAFSEMLSQTSTTWAPWYVIPADHKWFARICASAVIANALMEIDPQYPKVSKGARRELATARKALEAEESYALGFSRQPPPTRNVGYCAHVIVDEPTGRSAVPLTPPDPAKAAIVLPAPESG